ncbi:MAG: CYTH and CHAD domain-containing protein [Actinoplanes sp.]
MEIATETERKYDVPDDFELPSLAGAAGAATHDLDATYFDTDDLLLMRNRRTLRRRTGGDDAGWHLKTPGDGTSRTEHRMPLGERADEVPAELVGQVRAIIRRRPLGAVGRLRTHRVETPLRDANGATLALVAQDQVIAESDGHEQRWQEVEVELVDGGPELLETVEQALFAAGATPAAGPSKVARALGDRLKKAQKKAKVKTTTKVNPVFAYAGEQRDALVGFDPGVRQGDGESVHKMRVATRRLRSTLKTFKRSFPDAGGLRDELKWLADLLGTVRDGQVQKGKLLADVEGAGPEFAAAAERIRQHLDEQVERGRAELVVELEGERYLTLLDRVDALTDDPAAAEDDPLKRARRSVAKADGLLDQALADGEDAELHEARKAYKVARYAVEVFQPSAGKPVKRLVDALTGLQDVLGHHQDSVVARELLRELGPDDFWFGVLWARQEQVGRDTYAQLPVAVEDSRKKNLRKWLG